MRWGVCMDNIRGFVFALIARCAHAADRNFARLVQHKSAPQRSACRKRSFPSSLKVMHDCTQNSLVGSSFNCLYLEIIYDRIVIQNFSVCYKSISFFRFRFRECRIEKSHINNQRDSRIQKHILCYLVYYLGILRSAYNYFFQYKRWPAHNFCRFSISFRHYINTYCAPFSGRLSHLRTCLSFQWKNCFEFLNFLITVPHKSFLHQYTGLRVRNPVEFWSNLYNALFAR